MFSCVSLFWLFDFVWLEIPDVLDIYPWETEQDPSLQGLVEFSVVHLCETRFVRLYDKTIR